MMLEIRHGRSDDIDIVEAMVRKCANDLKKKGIYQWNECYPTRETFTDNMKNNNFFVFQKDGKIIGTVVLNESQDKEWERAQWKFCEEPILVIHAFALSPDFQGKGYGKEAYELIESYGRTQGYKSIRLDAFSENSIALYLYEKYGFKRSGEVVFLYKPEGHQVYYCYEKEL